MSRPSQARRRVFVGSVILLWLASTGWLVLRESYPGLLHEASAISYRTLLSKGLVVADDWMKVSFQGRSIGYSHTTVDMNEANPVSQYRLHNRTLLDLNLMGSRQRISTSTEATVDALYNLQTFSFVLSAAGYTAAIDGRRTHGQVFAVTVRSTGSVRRMDVTIPDDTVIYSPMTEMALRSLAPGKQMILRTFNPMTLAPQNITIRSLRKETIRSLRKEVEATVLAASVEGMETQSWIDENGKLLRQETAFGWTMEACLPGDAFADRSNGGSHDLLAAMAVPTAGPVGALVSASSARLQLTGAPLLPANLESQRQTVLSVTGTVAEIEVHAERLPVRGLEPGAAGPELAPFLTSSPFLQSDDRRMILKAREITGPWADSMAAARAIYDWVNRNVEKKPTVSLPSALDVLLRPEGDCNEHTYLFVALARAAGIPARIRVGLTLHEGLFYYHAWPSVYVGRWLDMDPTLGQPAVDAGHISLFEGELQEQVKLMGVLGRLNIRIVETRNQTP